MVALFLFLTAPTAAFWLYALATLLWTLRTIRVLEDAPVAVAETPRVSVVSPACNEASSIEGSVESWLEQREVELSIVVVDDRSTDETGAIVDRLASEDPRVRAVHLQVLPEGWLGKVHALHRGTEQATGDWLLFADADVRLAPTAIARSVAYAESHGLDLVTAYPEIESAGFWGDVVWGFLGAATGAAGIWRSRDPKSDRAFGVGAFILIRRSAFDETPGFPWLKLEVADDQALAMLLKSHGRACDIVNGRALVKLTWYTSLADMVAKSQKNWFAILGRFSLARSLVVAAVFTCGALSPLAMLLPGVPPVLWGIPLVGQLAFFAAALIHARWTNRPLLPVVAAPLGALLMAFMVVRAGVIGHRMGGIQWRGVLYPSAMLRDHQRFKM